MTDPQSAADLARRIVATAGDAIVAADRDGRVILWNRGAETMFGYPADEAIGESLDLIIPEGLRARHWDGYRQTMATGVTRYADDLLAVPGRRRDGSRISLEFRVAILAGRDGRPEAIAAVLRDVTARRAEDRALREELARLQAAATPTEASGPERRPRDLGGSSQPDSRRPVPEGPPATSEGPEAEQGGDPACWAGLLCPDCGAVLDGGPHRQGCRAGSVHADPSLG